MQIKSNGSKETFKLVFFILIIVTMMSCLFFLPRLTVPLIISYVLFLILSPFMQKLIKIGFGRTISAAVILTGVIFLSTYPIVKIIPIISNEANNIQNYAPKIESYLKYEYSKVKVKIAKKTGYDLPDSYVVDGIEKIRTTISTLLITLPNLVSRLLEWFFVIPLFVFFLLRDFTSFRKKFVALAPNKYFEKLYMITHQFNEQLGGYILAKFIEASILGVIITTGLLIMDVRFAIMFGILAAITNVIPYLGPILGTVPALIFGMVEYGPGTTFGALAILYMVANAIDIAIVFPILVSKIVDLHPVIVVVSVIVGSQFMGIVGMIISIPVAAACKLIFIEFFGELYSS